jgi:hypothetical protein
MEQLKKILSEDIWTLAEGENGGTPFILRYRPNLQPFIDTNQYNKRLIILWSYDSDNDSLIPSEADMNYMSSVEDRLIKVLENDLHTILAFVYTGQNKREWHWYSKDIIETGTRLNSVLNEFEKLPIELNAEDDPLWNEYNGVLGGAGDAEYDESDGT